MVMWQLVERAGARSSVAISGEIRVSGQPILRSGSDGPSSAAHRQPRAAFLCGLASLIAAFVAGLLAVPVIPGGTSGEAMLLLIFVALPLAAVSLGLAAFGSRSSGRRSLLIVGALLALVVLVTVGLVVLVVYLSWSRCAPSCI